MNVTITQSNKGKEKLFLNGFCYHLDKQADKSFYWCCAYRKNNMCKSRMITVKVEDKHVIKKEPTVHSHPSVASDKHVTITNNLLKMKAKTNIDINPSQLIRDAIVNTDRNCRVYLPSKGAQKIKISRIRKNDLKEPTTLQEINIPDHLKFLEGELFVLDEKEFEQDVNILLGTKSSMKLLAEAQCWLIDGTFYHDPIWQLLSILNTFRVK